jgi:hypothetical protein
MWWRVLVCVLVIVAIAEAAQVTSIPVPFGFSNSVIGHDGKLWIFDVTYQYSQVTPTETVATRFPPTTKTTVTQIESDASGKRSSQYDGSFQIAGVGRYAVYAIVTDSVAAPSSPNIPTSVTRHLVAMGSLFPTLPSIDIPSQSDVKVSNVGDDGTPDTIAFIDRVPAPLILSTGAEVDPATTVASTAIQMRTVQMFRSDGKSFVPLPTVIVPLQ